MPDELHAMRGLLDAQGVEILRVAPTDLFNAIAELTPGANARLAQTSHAVRARLAAMRPLPPTWFYANLDAFPAQREDERRESMLAELEAKARRFRLVSIDVAGIKLDEPEPGPLVHPPMLAPERGAVRFAAVLEASGASLEALDLSFTRIAEWAEINAALPACQALQRVTLSGVDFGPANNPFLGLAQCAALRELVIDESDLGLQCQQLMPVLANCRGLESLTLASNHLCRLDFRLAVAAPVLQHVLGGLWMHPSLARLDLRNCLLNSGCFDLLAVTLPTCPRLEYLDVSDNNIEQRKIAGLVRILRGCAALRHLHMRQSENLTRNDLRALAVARVFRGLASLDLGGCELDLMVQGGGSALLEELPLCVRLASLELGHNSLGNSFVRKLAALLVRCPALRRLDVSCGDVTDAGIRALALNVPLCGLT